MSSLSSSAIAARLLLACGFLFTLQNFASAQSYSVRSGSGSSLGKKNRNKTIVSIELITGKQGVGFQAQRWQSIFQRLNVNLRIRRKIRDDKPEIRQRMQGPLRLVTAIGEIDRNGTLHFPGHKFTRSDSAKLTEWIRELQTYGAKGSPLGKPLWGLTKASFGRIYEALSQEVKTKVEGQSLKIALSRIGVPSKYSVRLTTTTQSWLRTEFDLVPNVRQSVKGFAKGTALAMVLNDYGLGFRPLRTPEGNIELVVDPLRKTIEAWPVGWEPRLSRPKTAPALFKLIPVELNDVKLVDVLDAASVATEIPIRLDHYRIEAKGIDLNKLVVSYPPKRTTWSLLLSGLTNRHKLTRRVKIDEQGQPFVWITTLVPGRPAR